MMAISFELCIQCFFNFSLMHKKRILSDSLFVFLPYGIVSLYFLYRKNSCFSCWNRYVRFRSNQFTLLERDRSRFMKKSAPWE